MFTYALDHEPVSESVVKKVHKVKMFNPEERLRFLSEKEIETLLSVCASHLQPIVVTVLHTGMRRGEILKLVWSQVDLEHGFILLSGKENKKANKAGTKSRKKREIPIDNTLRALLRSIPRHFTGEGENRQIVPYVFCDSKTLKPYGDIKNSFHTSLNNAKIEDFHFHDLRHSFASHFIMNGGHIKTLREIFRP
jgi:integrase